MSSMAPHSFQPWTCFEIKLSFIWYCFHVTITRRQRIVHVHVFLLQLIDHH